MKKKLKNKNFLKNKLKKVEINILKKQLKKNCKENQANKLK